MKMSTARIVQELLDKLVTNGVVKPDQIKGLSESEISVIETRHRVRLPSAYRAFLARAGRGAGDFLAGTDVFVRRLYELHDWTLELFEESGVRFDLSPSMFVFGMHQGYEALFFDTAAGEDPPVYQFVQNQGPPEVVWPSFTAYVRDMVRQYVPLRPESDRD